MIATNHNENSGAMSGPKQTAKANRLARDKARKISKWDARNAVRDQCDAQIRDLSRRIEELQEFPPVSLSGPERELLLSNLSSQEAALLQQRDRLKRDPRPTVTSSSMGDQLRHGGGDSWTDEVIRRSGGSDLTREAYMAVSKRAVLAAFAAAGVTKKEAERSVEYRLATLGSHGEPGALRALKKRSGEHRGRWVNHQAGERSAQLSFIGRALPPGSKEDRVQAVLQHKADLTSTFVTSPEILDRAKKFARRWAVKRLKKPSELLGPMAWPSASSCLERGAGRGGQLRHLLATHSFDDLPVVLPEDRAGAVAGVECRFIQAALKELSEMDQPPARVTCLSERGLKTRVVTVSPASCQTLGHAVRKRLLRALKATPGAFAPLTGASSSEIGDLLLGGAGDTLVSTDLTRATDLLPLDLVASIVEGLVASGRLSAVEAEVLRILTGPQKLQYGNETFLSSRGILMGLPTSWCILSLIHLFWLEEAFIAARIPRRLRRYAICGDDALVLTNKDGKNRYRQIVTQCGGQASDGKHYESEAKPGGTLRGVFLEKLYDFTLDPTTKLVCRSTLCPVIPVKGLTSRSLPREYFGDHPVRCDSYAMVQISVLDLLGREEAWVPACTRYIARACPWLGSYAKTRLTLVPGHPLSVGGYRFAKRTAAGDALAAQLMSSGRSFTMSLSKEADPCWASSVEMGQSDLDRLRRAGRLIDVGFLPPLGWDCEGPLMEGQSRLPEFFFTSRREEYEMAATMDMFYQLKAFSDRPAEVFKLRARHAVKLLNRLRAAGAKSPQFIPVGYRASDFLIAWKPRVTTGIQGSRDRPSHSLPIRQRARQGTVEANLTNRFGWCKTAFLPGRSTTVEQS